MRWHGSVRSARIGLYRAATNSMLCDSNILIYAADPADDCCGPYVHREDAVVASVSRIEVLGFPGFNALSTERQTRLREIIESMVELTLNEEVIQRAITLRQERRMSLADAVVGASALVLGVPLVTRNVDDFRHLTGLQIINPFAREGES